MRVTIPDVSGAPLHSSAIFIDYENIHEVLSERSLVNGDGHTTILNLIEDISQALTNRDQTHISLICSYADYSEFADTADIQHQFGKKGIEPRFVSTSTQRNAVELQLCIDAMDTIYRTSINTLVLITGDRLYLPLVQQIEKCGRRAHVLVVERPPKAAQLLHAQTCIAEIATLLGQDYVKEPDSPVYIINDSSGGSNGTGFASTERTYTYQHLTDPLCIAALEIIEEYFGQYDEIYLTPLLRKLTEMLDEEDCDPKGVISDLEASGAVWLERRQGSPHDYTVLMLDRNHPNLEGLIQATS